MRPIALFVLLAAVCSSAYADWQKDLTDAATRKANSQIEKKLGLPNPAPPGAAVYFINLKNGDTVTNPLLVQFGLKNAGVSPGGLQSDGTNGHHHLLIDDPQLDATVALPASAQIKHFSKGETETMLTLSPGKHTLQLLFADWKDQPFNPSIQSDKITITVSGTAAPAK